MGYAQDEPRSLEESWPLIQTILTFAFSWNVGILESGRRVQAGWKKSSRLARASVLTRGDPPMHLLVYADLASGMGGRVLNNCTAVTAAQMVLFAGDGFTWK